MRVLYVHRQEGTAVGGGWRALCGMMERIRTFGVDPELLFTCDRQRSPETEGMQVHRLRLPSARKGRSLPLYPGALARLARFLQERRPDVIHLNDLDDTIFFVLATRWAGSIPVVGHARSLLVPGKFRKYRAHRLERLVCVSEAVALDAARAGVAADRILVLHDPPDPRWKEWPPEEDRTEWRERLGIPPGVLVVGTVGNLSQVKGTDVLVRALPVVAARFPEVRCVVVGGDAHGLRGGLAALADELGVSRNLLFAGSIPDPRPAVSLMDVFVLPSREEGYGLVLLEAMSFGKPVVASSVGGVPEIIPDDGLGVLVPPADPGALGEAISGLLADPERRKGLGSAGAARIREKFGNREMEMLYRMYRDLVRKANE